MASHVHTRAFLASVLPAGGSKRRSLDSEDSDDSISDPTQPFIDLLQSEKVAEDDRPDLLKDLLATSLAPSEVDQEQDLDSLVLSILHRHREDVAPSGQVFDQPTTPLRSSAPLSRSSSYKRTPLTGSSAPRRTVSGIPLRPHSPSPLRPQSPALVDLRREGEVSLPNSPAMSSPRLLSVAANEFQPRVVSAPSPKLSPNPWSPVHRSTTPVGTPKGLSQSNGSYFPPIPRDPWSDTSPASLVNASHSASSESSVDEPAEYDPFAPWQGSNGLPGMNAGTPSAVEISDPFGIEWNAQQQAPQPPITNNFEEPVGYSSPAASFATEMEPGTAYTMTPMDMLCSVFAGTDITPAEVEHALGRNGWDVDKAMEWLVSKPPNAPPVEAFGGGPVSPSLSQHQPLGMNIGPERPSPVRHESYGRLHPPASHSPRDSAPGSPRWGSRPTTPSAPNPTSYPASAATNRVCRYYLQGSCLRSDCRYNHDISKAVCRFWLRGHCLKGPERCDFMHHIPTHLTADVALLRIRDRAERAERQQQAQQAHMVEDLFRDDQDDFPTLSWSQSPPGSNMKRSVSGPGAPPPARWSGAVKNGVKTVVPQASLSRSHPPVGGGPMAGMSRASTRLSLRPPTLMPTLSTGQSLTDSYASYRQTFIDLGAARAKCLQRAADCYRRGDPAGARSWSREAQAHDIQRQAAGRDAARQILGERKAELKAAVGRDNQREGRVDTLADRSTKGKDCGAGLGVFLGVAASAAVTNGSSLSSAERTEAAIDLQCVETCLFDETTYLEAHSGLHAEEALESVNDFLTGLEREGFLGLAFLFVGQERHTVRQVTRTRLHDAVTQYLDEHKYPFRSYSGALVCDPLQHA